MLTEEFMSTSLIHPTAVIDPAACIHESVTIGPYAVIEDGVELGPHSVVGPFVQIFKGTMSGERCEIHAHCVIGGLPQALNFDRATVSGVKIGDRVIIREGSTINRSTKAGAYTGIGDDSFLMATTHVAHDCVVGKHVVMAHNSCLAGHVTVGDYTFVGGAAVFHQFCRIGEGAIIGGASRISLDVPPFTMTAERNELIGLNLVGLKRRGFSREAIKALKLAYREVCGSPGKMKERAAERLQAGVAEEVERCFLRFFADGKRGFVQPQERVTHDTEVAS